MLPRVKSYDEWGKIGPEFWFEREGRKTIQKLENFREFFAIFSDTIHPRKFQFFHLIYEKLESSQNSFFS